MLTDSGAENLLVIDQYRDLVDFYKGNVISLDSVAAEGKGFWNLLPNLPLPNLRTLRI